jgi:hypothetical protein
MGISEIEYDSLMIILSNVASFKVLETTAFPMVEITIEVEETA